MNKKTLQTIRKVFQKFTMGKSVEKATTMIGLLKERPNGLVVTDIMIRMRISQSETSQILKSLRDMNIVTSKKMGKHRLYTLNENILSKHEYYIKKIISLTKHHNYEQED